MDSIKEKIKQMENDPLCNYMEMLGKSKDMICKGCNKEMQFYERNWITNKKTFETVGPLCGKCAKKEMGEG